MADRHVLNVSPKTVQWGVWDASLEPVLRVKSGDLVEIHTTSGEPEDLPPGNVGVAPEQLEVHAKCRHGPGPHFLTGPVWVEDAEPGDALEVRIREVRLRDDWGWNLILPLRGTLPEDFPEVRRMHLPIDRRAMTARLPWGKEVQLKPFFGNFGVAPPARYGAIDSIVPREHGGNMDSYSLCSIAADLRVTQTVDGNKGIHCVLPKAMLETWGLPPPPDTSAALLPGRARPPPTSCCAIR